MTKLFAYSKDPDQMPQNAVSDLIRVCSVCQLPFVGLHCLLFTLLSLPLI